MTKFFLQHFNNNTYTQPAYEDITLPVGDIRIHFPMNAPQACDAVLFGVGTAMTTKSYNKLSEQITNYGYPVVIMDQNPGHIVKTNEKQFLILADAVKANLLSWLNGASCTSISHWIVGGHSAGGEAAFNAVVDNFNLADAVFSIDPYAITNKSSYINVSSVYWGFNETTCGVNINKAALAAYKHSGSERAFYRVEVDHLTGPCGYSPTYFHCSVCDEDCPACTNCEETPQSFYVDIANSVNKFIQAAFYDTWSRDALTINSTTPLTLYVDNELPPEVI